MERKEGGNGPLPEDARRELGRCGVGNALFHNELHAYKRMFNEDEKMDESYKILLVCLFTQEKQFAVPQTKKQNGKLDEPLLPILRSNRSEQLLRRVQDLNSEDNDVCENVGPGSKEEFEMPNKRKGKGLLIHYVDYNIHGVVGKNQNGKDHVIEHEDDVREDSEQTLRDCLVDRENGVKAFELEKKRKGQDLFTEHDDQLLRADSVKTLTERFEQGEKQNEKASQEERSEPPLIIKQKDNDDTKNEDDSGYKLFLKLMDEYKQAKNEALPKDAATVENEEGVGSNKDNEPEPERKSTATVKPNVELPIQVPSPLKRSNVGNLTNDESEKAEIEKCSARQPRKSVLEEPSDKGEDENMEIQKRLSRRSRKVVYKEQSDEDEREEIEKHPSCEVGKNRKDEKVKADIEKCSSRRSRKVNYKEPSDEDMDDDEREDIVKHPSHEVGNVFMKNPQDKNEKADDTEKRSSRRSSKVTYKEPSDEDGDGGEEIEKRPSHKIGNVFMKNPKDKNEKVDIEKCSSRRSRKIAYNDLLSNEDERETKKFPSREVRNVTMKKSKNENVEADVEKNSSRRSRKAILEESSDEDENAEIKKHSSREVRNVVMKKSKNEKAEAEIEKHPSHRSKKVFYKEHSSGKDEDETEEIEKRSSREVRNNVVMKKSKKAEAEIEKLSSRRSREVIYKDYSSNDEREEIQKRSSREVRNVVMKKPKNEKAESEIEKHPSHRSKKVFYKEHSSGKDEDEREEIRKRSSREVRNNMVMKKSKKAEAEIEKLLSRRSREVFYKDYSSNDDREEIEKRSSRKVRNNVVMKKSKKAEAEIEKLLSRRPREVFYEDYSSNDEREEIEKRSSRKVRNNVVMKKSKKAEAEIEKLSSRRSRGVSYKDYSSNENNDVEIKKRASRRLWKAILAELSEKDKDVYMEIERRSPREVRNVAMKKHKNEKVKDEIEKRSSHQSRKVCSPNESTNATEILLAERKARDDRKVAMKRLRDEDIEEQIERLRNYLLKRSRYGIEGRTSHNFRVGESSAHPKKTDKDSLEDEESSDDDSELEILDKDECLNGPFVTAKSYINLDDDCYKSSEECMEFRGKVLEVISKPYDKSEYNALYAEFREQCYPSHHPDLVDKLKMNRWRPRKRLAILRGFFFWLQNLTRKGSFKPWNDSVCLDVEPEWPLQTRQTPGNRLGK